MGWVVEGEPAHGESARILTYLERGHAFGTLDVGVFQLSFHRLPAVRVDVAIDPQHMQVESGRLTPRGLVAFLHKPARGRRHREEDDEASRRGPGERGPGATGATEAEGATGAEGAVGRVRPREGSGEASRGGVVVLPRGGGAPEGVALLGAVLRRSPHGVMAALVREEALGVVRCCELSKA